MTCPTNRNLEALAKQLYDYWFVQFDFPDENGMPYKTNGGKMVWNEQLKREIPNGWIVKRIGDVLGRVVSTPRLVTDEYMKTGRFPIIDQTTDVYFAGFTDREETVLNQHPVVVFGDHSCAVKYVNFPFVRGADGTQIMIPNNKRISPEYLYFVVKGIKIGKGYARHFCFLKDSLVIIPEESISSRFKDYAVSLMKGITQNRLESLDLIKQSDALLPLLMNGQVNSDLIANLNVYCLDRHNPNNMKEKIIDNVMAAMQSKLDCQQMKLLKVTLQEQLLNVNVTMTEQPSNNNNLSLLETFISAKRIEGCSERSLRYYQSSIEQFFCWVDLPITQIDTASIRNYLARYQAERKCSKVTIDNMRRILSSFFAWLEDEDYIVKSPVRRIHKVKTDSLVRETLSDEQLEQLRDRCDNSRDLAIIDMLSSTGMRVGELVKLNRQDVNFEERQCVVFGKGNKERIVYFNARTKIHLQAYLAERTDSEKALFVSLKAPHHRLQISGVERRMKKLGQSVQINRVHPHKFRRTLATMAIDKGMPIEQVQRLLGHVRIDTTLHYAMVSQQNVKMSHKKYLG